MPDLLAYQQRVVDEKKELDDKLARLVTFFTTPTYNNLPTMERALLSRQASVMGEYSDLLGKRIMGFGNGE